MLAKKLTDLIKVYDDILSEEKCQEVIDLFEGTGKLWQRFDNNGKPNFTQLNLTQYAQSNDENLTEKQKELHTYLTTTFMNVINLYQMDCSITDEMPNQWALEQIRIKKYNQAVNCCNIDTSTYAGVDVFNEHVDVGDYNSARRFLSLFLYLNHTEGTGKTSFPYLDLDIDPIPGRVLAFPPMWMYPHAGHPSFKTNKYIVGTYCHYL